MMGTWRNLRVEARQTYWYINNYQSENQYLQMVLKLQIYFKGQVYLKRSGKEYKQLHRDIVNGYIAKSREYSQDLGKANLQLKHYIPLVANKKKDDGE